MDLRRFGWLDEYLRSFTLRRNVSQWFLESLKMIATMDLYEFLDEQLLCCCSTSCGSSVNVLAIFKEFQLRDRYSMDFCEILNYYFYDS